MDLPDSDVPPQESTSKEEYFLQSLEEFMSSELDPLFPLPLLNEGEPLFSDGKSLVNERRPLFNEVEMPVMEELAEEETESNIAGTDYTGLSIVGDVIVFSYCRSSSAHCWDVRSMSSVVS